MPKCVTLDTHVLHGYVTGHGSHRNAIQIVRKLWGAELCIPPSVLVDLEGALESAKAHVKQAADDTVDAIENGPFEACPLEEVDWRIIESRLETLIAKGAISEAQKDSVRVLLESAHIQAEVLITTNPVLTDHADRLQDALLSLNLHPVLIRESKQIVDSLNRR